MKQTILLLLLLAALFVGCNEQKVEPKKVNVDTKEIPAQESWGSTIVFTDSGKTKAIIYTNHLRMFTQAQETLLDDSVHIDFYDRFQKRSTTLTSKRGKVDDRQKNLFAYENVVAKNDSGVTLLTEELMWDNTKQQITTDKFVTIITPTEKIQGYGFESDQFIRNYIIHRPTYITNGSSFNK
jgi:LPS export ABC transporter protein LptC